MQNTPERVKVRFGQIVNKKISRYEKDAIA